MAFLIASILPIYYPGLLSVVEKKEKNVLTHSLLWSATITMTDRSIPLPSNLNEINSKNFKFILGIFAPAKDFLKVTLYYLNSPNVTKITFWFGKLDDATIRAVSLAIKDFKEPPIHVSGFCMKDGKYIYELYARGTRQDSKNILQSLKKIVPNFESIIEELPLQTTE